MKLFLKIFIAFLFLVQSCASNKSELPPSFHFLMHNGKTDFYNSETENFQRDYKGKSLNYKITLTNKEKLMIYKKYKEIRFNEFPNAFKFAGGNQVMGFPSFFTELKICENENCHEVILNLFDIDNNQLQEHDKAIQYSELYFLIWRIIQQKEIFKSIPYSDMEYM